MSDIVDLVARLRAYQQGRAVPIASHRRVALHPQALLFCPIVMAGEDTAIHMVMLGQLHQQPHTLAVPDPRNRQALYLLFEDMSDKIDTYFQDCLNTGTYPQIWVSSGAGAGLIDKLADRLRGSRSSAKARRLGQLLAYPAQRVQCAGQQTLLIAPNVLSLHWATGQQSGEDEHLFTILTWIKPPSTHSIHQSVEQAEMIPSGIKTDPAFDRTTLVPLVAAFNRARRRRASPVELDQCTQRIRDTLFPVVSTIYAHTLDAYHALQGSGLSPLPSLPRFEQRERDEFAFFMQQLASGYQIPLHDSVRAAIYGLTAREDAVELVEAVLQCEDVVERMRGRLSGHIITGEVRNVQRQHIGPRRYHYRFQFLSTQQEVRVRERDEFYWADDLRLKVCVETIQHQTGSILITLLITEGMRSVGLPLLGTRMDLVSFRPDWDKLSRERLHLSRGLCAAPWNPGSNHNQQGQSGSLRSAPADPLRLVEDLQ